MHIGPIVNILFDMSNSLILMSFSFALVGTLPISMLLEYVTYR